MEEGLASQLAEIALDLAAQPDLASTLGGICSHAVATLDADRCGIFLVENRRIKVAAMSGPHIEEAERAQTASGQGPCLETIWHNETIHIADMRTETRWPDWTPRMVELGWLCTLSLRLVDRTRTVGSLNLFCRKAHAFGPRHLDVGELFAGHASVALRSAREEQNLHQAIDARHLVGVAQGILMERYNLDLQSAFDVMKRHSQQGNVKLHRVAEHVIEHRELPAYGLTDIPASVR